MERATSASQKSQSELQPSAVRSLRLEQRSTTSLKDAVGLDKNFLCSKVNDIRQKLQELESGSFLEQVARIERSALFYSEQAEALGVRCVLVGVEAQRLGQCLEAANGYTAQLEEDLVRVSQQLEEEGAALRARLAERERQLARVTREAEEAGKAAREERAELAGKLSAKEALEREMVSRSAALLAEVKSQRAAAHRAKEELQSLGKRIPDLEQDWAERLATAERAHHDELQRLEADRKAQFEAFAAQLTEQRRREEERERQRLADQFRQQLVSKDAELAARGREAAEVEERLRHAREEGARLNAALAAAHAALEDREAELEGRDGQLSARLAEAEDAAQQERAALQHKLSTGFKVSLEAAHAQHEAEVKSLRKKLIDAENSSSFLAKEKAFLESNLSDARLENERQRAEAFQLREDFEEELEALTQQIETYRSTFIDPRELEVRFRAERSSYDAQVNQLHNKVTELNAKIASLTEDNQRIHLQALARLQEIELFKTRNAEDEEGLEATALKKKVAELRRENDSLQEKGLRLGSERNQIAARVQGLESEVELARSEVVEMQKVMQLRREELREGEEAVLRAKRHASELQTEKSKMAGELITLQEKNQTFMANFESLIKERDHYKRSYENNDLQHSYTNKNLMDKIREVDELRAKYEDALANFENKNSWQFSKKPARKTPSQKDDFSHLS